MQSTSTEFTARQNKHVRRRLRWQGGYPSLSREILSTRDVIGEYILKNIRNMERQKRRVNEVEEDVGMSQLKRDGKVVYYPRKLREILGGSWTDVFAVEHARRSLVVVYRGFPNGSRSCRRGSRHQSSLDRTLPRNRQFAVWGRLTHCAGSSGSTLNRMRVMGRGSRIVPRTYVNRVTMGNEGDIPNASVGERKFGSSQPVLSFRFLIQNVS